MNEKNKDLRVAPSGATELLDKEDVLILQTFVKIQMQEGKRKYINLIPAHPLSLLMQHLFTIELSHDLAGVKKPFWE